MPSHSRLLRREFTGNLSLKTTDHCKKASFLAEFTPRTPVAIPETRQCVNGQFLLELDNVLSSPECTEIISNAELYIFENMNDKYRFGKQRKSSRLLALDKSFAEHLWNEMKAVLETEMQAFGVSMCPHGFDVTRGLWELHGLNEAMRINKYSGRKREYFGPHKDAQFCPNGDERSIFTLLVYLNEGYQGGETCFYFPKTDQSTKGLTIKEEIQLHGGLKEGYNCVKIVPKIGHAVISSQDILHESLPIVKGTKYILKTDLVVKRHSKQFGFAVEERERKDYVTCLNFFREAQQEELQGNFDVSSDLYERALSIRYCYPQALEKSKKSNSQRHMERDVFSILPPEVWYHVFKYMSGYDAQSLVYAYPELNPVMERWELHRRKIASCLSNEKYLPTIRYQKGVITCFEFSDAEYFRENMTACCRVAAMYSFFLLGHKPQDNFYTVRYNPDTQDVCIVALETLLTDVFYGRRCYGSFYNVCQVDPERKDPKKDFEASVDRNYMLMKHGVEFTGVELPDSFYVKSAVYLSPGDSYDESDEEESGDDINDENEDGKESCGDDDGDNHVSVADVVNGDTVGNRYTAPKGDCNADDSSGHDNNDAVSYAGNSVGDCNQYAADERAYGDGVGHDGVVLRNASRKKYVGDEIGDCDSDGEGGHDQYDDHAADGIKYEDCGIDESGDNYRNGAVGNEEKGKQNSSKVNVCGSEPEKAERDYEMSHEEEMEANENDSVHEGSCQKIMKICAKNKEFARQAEKVFVHKKNRIVILENPLISMEIYDGFIPYYGEINEKFPAFGILKYFLLWKDISNMVPLHIWRSYDVENSLNPETAEERVDDVTDYFGTLADIDEDHHVSVARVSRLIGCVSSEVQDFCICHFGPEDGTSDYVDELCATEFFNHLVFDFQGCQLSVKFFDACPHISMTNEVDQFYRDFVASEMASLDCEGETVYCEVKLESVLSPHTSFNHASCQCAYPYFEFHEYYNLKDYPGLCGIDIIAKEKSGKMLVWTIYDGITAL